MDDANHEGQPMTACHKNDCPGGLEECLITHTVRHEGELVVIDRVPAEVCDACGETLLMLETVRKIDRMVREREGLTPSSTVPLYEFA